MCMLLSGTVGLFVGATSGILRSTTPVLFSLVTGAQWFALGSSYYGKPSPLCPSSSILSSL